MIVVPASRSGHHHVLRLRRVKITERKRKGEEVGERERRRDGEKMGERERGSKK